MPRAGWVKPESDRRFSDLVSVGVLSRVFPAHLVDEVITECGRTERRHRSLPARVMAYFAIGMALDASGSYEDVMAQLIDGLAWASGWSQEFGLPSASAIFQARARLGAEPIRRLFERVAVPLAGPEMAGAFLAGRRMVAIDGTTLDVADTAANEEFFTRPPHSRGEASAFPQARIVALAECATHAVLAARIGAYKQSEAALTRDLVDHLGPSMLLIADRGFFSYKLWRQCAATGAGLLWRMRTDAKAPRPVHVADLLDGAWLAHLRRRTPAAERNRTPITARIIDYTVDDGRDQPTVYRLATTLTDPSQVSAAELAAAYTRRWEIEMVFDELKTHQRGPRMVLRSKSPELVLQEIWGHLCCHYAIRALMGQAGLASGTDPGRISFTTALRTTRKTLAQPGAFPP